MRPSSLAGHVLDLCALTENNSTPVDKITWTFFKERHYLGSRDRANIRASLYGMQREWRRIQKIVSVYKGSASPEMQLPDGKERYLPMYIAHVLLMEKKSPEDIIGSLGELWQNHYPGISFAEYLQWLNANAEDSISSSDPVERIGNRYSFPDWMVSRLLNQYGDETESLLAGLNKEARTTLRVNLHKISRADCMERMSQEGVPTVPTQHSPSGLVTEQRYNRMASATFKEGLYEFQDEGSQLISLIANPKPGELVIDACAGGGGKTGHLNEMMKDSGKIIAIDIDMYRLKGLDARIKRSNLTTIELYTTETLNRESLLQKADLVLIDAPCSGIGRIRRSPDIKWRLKEFHVDSYPEKQLNILKENAEFVKPGGRLVYATCSLFKSENEDVVQSFLTTDTRFMLSSPDEELSRLGIQTVTDRYIRILPHIYPTDGFFVAVMERMT